MGEVFFGAGIMFVGIVFGWVLGRADKKED